MTDLRDGIWSLALREAQSVMPPPLYAFVDARHFTWLVVHGSVLFIFIGVVDGADIATINLRGVGSPVKLCGAGCVVALNRREIFCLGFLIWSNYLNQNQLSKYYHLIPIFHIFGNSFFYNLFLV